MKKLTTILTFIIMIFPINIYALDITSDHYILYDMDSWSILYEENSNEATSIASLTKIATAIAVIENTDDLSQTITIDSDDLAGLTEANASVAGFWVGQSLTIEDLLYGLLLPSGADAANALYNYMQDNNEDLVSLMNDLADSLNLENTNFVDTTGLLGFADDNHYSTAYDMAQILNYALQNETFYEIFTTDVYLTSDKNITLRSSFSQTVSGYSLDNEYIIGSKTGYTSEAGRCLASISNFDDTNYLLIVLNSDTTYPYTAHILDSTEIYEYVDNEFTTNTLFNEGKIIAYIPAEYSTVYQYNVTASENYEVYSDNLDDYSYEFVGVSFLNPESDAASIGVINIYYKDYLIDSIDVSYDGSLEYSFEGYVQTHLNQILIISASSIGALLILIIILKIKKSR